MMHVVEELSKLRLDVLDQDWVQGIYYSEFLEFGEFPPEYESVLESLQIPMVFRAIMRAIDDWLNSEDSDEEKSWAALSHHVKHQKLLALLAYYIDYGTKNVLTKEYRNNALLASRLYYKFMAIPGFKAYHIYHSQLFAHSLACLGFPKSLCENENNYFNIRELTQEVNSIIKELRHFVLDLRAIIDYLQLSPTDMNFEDILSNLVDITGGAIVNKLNVDKIELANISGVIYQIINILICDANDVADTAAIRLLFKCILPKLLAASMDSKNANNLVRASYVTYSGLLLTKYGKAALPSYTVLLEHLCYMNDGLERAEVRQARVSLVIGLMSLLPRKSYRQVVKWLLTLSASAKIPHRQIALELLSQLLKNDAEEEKPAEIKPEQTAEYAATTEGEEQPTKNGEEPNEGENPVQPDVDNQPQSNLPAEVSKEDESSQDSQETLDNMDEEAAGLLRQRAHTAPHRAILRAVYERVNDVSSTLRTRAYQVLADCLASDHAPMKQAIQELNGPGAVSRLRAAAARGALDERAAVRRAALALVHRSLAARPAYPAHPAHDAPHSEDLSILMNRCRDGSIIVRCGAISAISDMALRRPCDAVFDSLIGGPVRQVSDSEPKVQDLIVKSIQELLIDRIEKYVEGGCKDMTPWMFLAAITRQNMRGHLQKACTLIAKSSNCISVRLIDMLSTHLGAMSDERDLYTLVMLTSIARLVDYNDINFALDYYYKIADDTTARDPRLMALTLELLAAWARWARLAARSALRTHLVRRLAAAHDDGCRLSCVTLAAQLDPHDLTWATELMQLSEREAAGGRRVAEWVRAADLTLVAPAPPAPALLDRFLRAIRDPPREWSAEACGAAVAGLGRLCLRARAAAGAAAPALVALLNDAAAPLAPRVNALLVLSDICSRYTCIVEPLLGDVCGCLSPDADTLLRRTTSRCLTKLLLNGFLRMSTPLYYRFCALLADDDSEVREPVEYYMSSCLKSDVIFLHFVDCVLHYNNLVPPETPISFDARQTIYDVMLQRLTTMQKVNLQCRLAREVLEHAADQTEEGDGELSPAMNGALLDTINVLCASRMKLPKKPQRDGGEADVDDLQERVTANIVSHQMKRMVAEVTVPAALRLHGRLRARGGQVLAYLVRLTTDLLADYRHEIEELIENDEELVQSVRQFQETIGMEPSFGNSRNLVTSSTAHEPETPKAPRKRTQRGNARSPPRKRALRI